MSWQNVFNTHLEKWWGHIDKAREGAEKAGYQFFAWNGEVYTVADGKRTGIYTIDFK